MQKSEPKSGRWLSKTLPGPSCQRKSQCATWKRGQLQSCQRKSPLREESKELQNLFQKNTRNLPAQFCYWAGTWWHACCVSTSWPRLQKSDGNMVLINSWHLKAAFCCTSMRKLNCILIAWKSCGDLWIQADNQLVQLTISIWQKALAHIQSPAAFAESKSKFWKQSAQLLLVCMLHATEVCHKADYIQHPIGMKRIARDHHECTAWLAPWLQVASGLKILLKRHPAN